MGDELKQARKEHAQAVEGAKAAFDKSAAISEELSALAQATIQRLPEKPEDAHLTSIASTVYVGVVIVNDQSKIIIVNEAAEKLFGYETGELLGETGDVPDPA